MRTMKQSNSKLKSEMSAENEADAILDAFFVYGQLIQVIKDVDLAVNTIDNCRALPYKKALKQCVKAFSLKATFKKIKSTKIKAEMLPLIVKDNQGKWFILAKKSQDEYLLQYPDSASPELVSIDAFDALYAGELVLLSASKKGQGFINKFDVSWFIPELTKYKGLAFELLAASALLQLLALISPLFFQIVMDKVLVHNAVSTLDVLVTVLIAGAILEVLLQTLRQYLANRTAIRIDAKLGSKLYQHLIDLPLSYFKTRPVGVTVMRVSELNSIREFITGAANTLVIDLFFTLIFFSVMYLFSPFLTLIVVISLPCYMLVSLLITGPLQRKIEQLAHDSAINNSFLTESLTGVETVKALSLEAKFVRRWEYQTRDFVHSNFQVQQFMQLSSALIQVIQKVVTVLILWFGAKMVINLELSIGQLIAFNMMANHVSQPIIRLTELWRNFVQARVSVERLGDVLNTLPERSGHQQALPEKLTGSLVFDNVSFRYTPQSEMIIKQFNLVIPSGKMIAFVGKSGSGKSTITRLMQKLYVPEEGNIYIDGLPLSQVDPLVLRQKMSIVLQENFLFNRSVKDNIAIMDPSAPISAVIAAAKSAGAHEFILKLKDGYDTILAEGGASLSGGQRQRVAIARSLITNPSILIFDEATSALDDHSQELIKRNMDQIRDNKTVVLIAHRLSTVRDCDCIYVMDNGQIIESGRHDALIEKENGAYRQLWLLQSSELTLPVKQNIKRSASA